jgi:hypothetical protein
MMAIMATDGGGPFGWLPYVMSVAIGLFLGIVTEPFRLWLLRPVLTAAFTRDEHCLRETPARVTRGEAVFESNAKVVRFYVSNTRRFLATGCRAYLVRIEQLATDGGSETLFADRIPLTWRISALLLSIFLGTPDFIVISQAPRKRIRGSIP